MKESIYQLRVTRRLEKEFPGCLVIPNDPEFIQGIPDLLILFRDTWFMLEVKLAENSPNQPNQEYYVNLFNDMSFAMFIYPEIEDEVFDALQHTFCDSRSTRFS